ncbi:MAG TPA: Holliday junction branch migration protein RuvA [Candidatus Moranbacteria bacterium]|nr:MAG: Holliday junction ATP-dependent DNA helicase RuvA [Candidatus Moranbacteria bacterium GW2011_GWC2_45_10]KKT94521.1 MAG: Holliday junction ATP-dependent DNA helicase RuvA [Parcubacteria group bacterium GW2011_GWC1_45_14]HAV11217.1 Holliday junction branch migration protein RuvA [Candidatus Moranbacteria bacterium]
MIAKLKGKIDFIKESYVVVEVGGIGYKVFVTSYAMGKIAGMEEVEFYIHTHVREDILALYGFLSLDELEMFELLISVSGIGPKAGLGILTIADPKTIRTAVANEDASILTKVSGVGKKTAGRVILELKNKIGDLPVHEKHEVTSDSDALEALVAMGYSVSESRDALKAFSKDISDVGERVKLALRSMGKKK